ncbi:hypothetical protein Bca4012_070808 [Brassica carinata]
MFVTRDLARALDGSTTSHHDTSASSAATAGHQVGSHVSSEVLPRALDGSTTSHNDALATSAATADRQVGSHVSNKALKTIRVIFHHDSSLVVPITTNFPSVEKDVDVLKSLVRSKVTLLKEGAELRLLHVFQSKIQRIITTSKKLEDMSWVRVEECLEGEVTTGGTEMAIFGHHCELAKSRNKTLNYLGDPFVLCVHKGETLLQIKKKFESKHGVSGEDISKQKFACVSTFVRYLMDSEILHSFWKSGAELRVEHPSF